MKVGNNITATRFQLISIDSQNICVCSRERISLPYIDRVRFTIEYGSENAQYNERNIQKVHI